jgi:hypothetical protein
MNLILKKTPVRLNWTQISSPGHGHPALKMNPAVPVAPAAQRMKRN